MSQFEPEKKDVSAKPWGQEKADPVLFWALTSGVAAMPLVFLVAYLDGLNDKPDGSHATPMSYVKVYSVAAVVAGLATIVAWKGGVPKDAITRYFLFGFLAVALVNLTFCVWASCVFEFQAGSWAR